jgi:hypothetical protein
MERVADTVGAGTAVEVEAVEAAVMISLSRSPVGEAEMAAGVVRQPSRGQTSIR